MVARVLLWSRLVFAHSPDNRGLPRATDFRGESRRLHAVGTCEDSSHKRGRSAPPCSVGGRGCFVLAVRPNVGVGFLS
jgi:hypothetical protein